LERSGAQTEEELAKQTTSDRATLSKALLMLHRDRCVEYTADFVRVTERGRYFIDRLSLQDEIVTDLLRDVSLQRHESETIREVLLAYRSRSFASYLNSVAAVRTWQATCCSARFLPTDETDSAKTSGALAILFRDLQKWFSAKAERHVPTSENQALDRLKVAVFGAPGAGKSAAIRAIPQLHEWFEIPDVLKASDNPLKELRRLRSHHQALFCSLELSREIQDENVWLRDWSTPKGKWLVVLDACDSAADFFAKPELENMLLELGWRQQQIGIVSREDVFAPILRQNLGELLSHLLVARDLKDLALRTNSDEQTIRQILESINARCELLLEKKTDPAEPRASAH
jgi:hypothetical protein